jgi:pilus assembly protein CpaF
MVDAVLSVAGNDPHIQGMAAALEFTRDPEVDSRQKNELFEALKPALARGGVRIPDTRDVPFALQMAYDEIIGTSVFGDLWRDDAITEIMIDSWDKIVVEQGGRLHTTPMKFRSPEHANSVARNLALRISDRAVSQTIPLVTAELPQARVTFAYGAVVKGGLSITIRKFRELMTMDELIRYGSITPEMVDFLKDAVAARAGVLVSGGTGSGKTTVINLLSSFIPSNERVITIEDAFELQLVNTHVVSLQTKESSGLDDTVSVTLADLLRNTLRMRPDRIIVGEIREGEGALVMLSAATTGHEGTMTTIHANSADMALNERLTDLVGEARSNANEVSIRRSVASAFELVVQVTRGRHGRRFISEIASVDKVGADGTISVTPIFKGVQAPDGAVSFTRFPVDPSGGVGVRLAERKEVIAKWTAT